MWLLCAFGMPFALILRIPSTSPTLLPYIRWRSVGEVLEKRWRRTEGTPKKHKDHTEVTPLSRPEVTPCKKSLETVLNLIDGICYTAKRVDFSSF